MAFASAKILLAAIELGVFTELGRGPRELEDLASRVGVHSRGAPDFFDALVAVGLLERDDGLYRNTPEADCYLDQKKATYVGGLFKHIDQAHYPLWERLATGLATGEPQIQRGDTEEELFDFYEDSEQLVNFLDGMNAWSQPAVKALAVKFPFDRYQSVADIGSAAGNLLSELLVEHPQLRGIGFDLPPTAARFGAYTEARDVADRVRFVGGDFFEDALPTADVITFSHILHDWSVDVRTLLLRKAFEALPVGGAVVVVDAVVDNDRRTAQLPMLLSLSMLLATPGGGGVHGLRLSGVDARGRLS